MTLCMGVLPVRRGRYIGGLVGDANARISDVYSKVAINIDLGDYTGYSNYGQNTVDVIGVGLIK